MNLDISPALSHGTQKLGLQSTQKQETLTLDQKNLITTNLADIKNLITIILKKSKIQAFGQNPVMVAAEAISYLTDVTDEYDKDKAGRYTFAQFAAPRCILRLIDEYRKLNRHIRVHSAKRATLEEVIKHLIDSNIEVTDESINARLKELGFDPKRFEQIEKLAKSDLSSIKEQYHSKNKDLDEIEWRDLSSSILNKLDSHFVEIERPEFALSNANKRIRKILIKDYLLPKANGKLIKNLNQIAQEVGLTEGRLSQMKTDDSMRNFFAGCLDI